MTVPEEPQESDVPYRPDGPAVSEVPDSLGLPSTPVVPSARPKPAPIAARQASPGLTAAGVVVIVFGASLFGLLIDVFTGDGVGWLFGIVFIVVSAYAAFQVRRSDIAAGVIVPPLVFAALVVPEMIIASPGELLTKVVNGLNALLDNGPMLWIGSGLTVLIVSWRVWQHRQSQQRRLRPAPSGPGAAPAAARTADAPPPS